MLASGCYYGPPEDHALIKHVVALPDGERLAVAIVQSMLRQPKGLATFPNGGVARPVSRQVMVQIADGQPGNVRTLASIPVPEALKFGTDAWIEGWQPEAIFFRISGCAQNECWGDLRKTQHYRLAFSGEFADVDANARLAAKPLLPKATAGSKFLQVSHAFGVVQVMHTPNGTYQPAYRLLQNGALEPELAGN